MSVLASFGADTAERARITIALAVVAPFAWEYFHKHENDPLFSIIGINIKHVRDIRGMFVKLFGEEPTVTTLSPEPRV